MADPIPDLLKVVMQHTSTGMAIVEGKTLCFRWSNTAYHQFLDEPFRTRGVAGLPFAEVFPERHTPSLPALLRQVIADRTSLTLPEYEYPGFARGLTYWHIQLSAIAPEPPAANAGTPDVLIHMYEVTAAVAARKHAERLAEELRAANERWELAVRGTEDGIWDWDIANDHVYWSPRSKEMLGYRDDELTLTRDTVRDLIHPDDRAPAWATVQQQLDAGSRHYRGEYRLRHRDGDYRWVLARGLVVRDASGAALRIVGSHVDVTERRRGEEALRKSREQLLGIINNSPAMIFVKDLQGRYLLVNEPFNRGAGVQDATGLADSDLFDPPTTARLGADDRQVIASRTARTFEETIEYQGRTMHFLTTKFPLAGGDGVPYALCGIATEVTLIKEAQARLRESEEYHRTALHQLRVSQSRLRLFAESGVMGILYADPHGGISYANDEYLRIVGQPRQAIADGTLRWDRITPPEWHARDQQALAEAAQTGVCAPYEKEYLRPDGTRVPVLLGFVLGGEELQEATAFVLDLTEQKRTHAALRDSEQRLQLALDAGQMGTWEWTIAEGKVAWSPTLEKIHGRLPGSFKGTFEDVLTDVHPDDRNMLVQAIQSALANRTNHHVVYRITTHQGEERWVEAHGALLVDAAGAPQRMVGVCADITERRAIEDRLRSSEGRLQVALDTADLALWEVDLATGAVNESDRMIALFGLPAGTRHQTLNDWGRYVHPDDQARLAAAYEKALSGQGDYVAEHRLLAADGKIRWVSSRGRVVEGADGVPHMIGVSADVTAQKLAQEDLERAKEAAEAANSAKDRFLAVLSHELRTPLTPVVMTIAALDMDENVPPAAKQDLALIRRNIELETQLIDDLLDVTRIANGKLRLNPRPVRLHDLLQHVCTICDADARSKHIALDCDLSAPADNASADPARLEQVFWNLVKNAIKFTPEGGRVEVATRGAAEGALEVIVRDTGVGIAPEVKERIFNAFEQGEQTVTRTFGGLGLGLAISRAIVDLHGGRIWAESRGRGQGASFHVVLPLEAASAQERQPPAQASRAVGVRDPAEGPLRVLLVDDHADTVRVMERLLRALGMQIRTAGSVQSAVALLQGGEVDLLISDIGLPDGTGHDLILQAHRVLPGLPAIALSGFGMDTDLRRSLEAGFFTHLTKPISPERLQAAIAAALAGKGAG